MTVLFQPNEAWHGTLGDFFERDHARLDSLWAEFVSLRMEDPDGARRAFEGFRAGLERHMKWEDELLFAEFARRVDDHGRLLTDLLIWEHEGLRRWLDRLASDQGCAGLDADLECIAFAGTLAGHNRREETLVYPEVDGLLGAPVAAQVMLAMTVIR
jgi:regulator of cell morphogenesis and NO signaling